MSDSIPLRVAHVIGSVTKGGVESVVFNYYKHIDKAEVQFDFIIDENSPYEIPNEILSIGCKVYKTPPYTKLRAYTRALKSILTEGEYKIVHSHMNTLSVFALCAAKKARVPVRIAHSHSTAGRGKGEFLRNLMKYALRPFSKAYPTHLFACSEYAGRWLFGDKAFDKGRVTVIKNAIDVSRFAFSEETRSRTSAKLGIGDKFVIGQVGRFTAQKNHLFLIDIFEEVHKRHKESVLLLIGDGELRTQIEEKVRSLNLQNCVMFLGARDDVNELYQAMDVLILPSLYEGLSVVRVEAISAGCPCLVSAGQTAEFDLFDERFLPIGKKDVGKWADAILEKRGRYENPADKLRSTGYEIKSSVRKLEEKYKGMLRSEACI